MLASCIYDAVYEEQQYLESFVEQYCLAPRLVTILKVSGGNVYMLEVSQMCLY